MKIYIYAMSMDRGDLRAWIESHTRQTIVALAQLYLFPTGPRVHWREEVWSKFSEIHRLKPKNKLPSAKLILDNSYQVYKNQLRNLLDHAIDKEIKYTPISNIDESEFQLIVYDYFLWLANEFSQKDYLIKADVLRKLDQLGLTEQYDWKD